MAITAIAIPYCGYAYALHYMAVYCCPPPDSDRSAAARGVLTMALPTLHRTREAAMTLLREGHVEYPAMLTYAKVRV